MDLNNLNTTDTKSFWKKTEGKITLGIFGIIALLSVNQIDKIVATLLNIAQNTFLLLGISAVIFILGSFFFDKRVRAAISVYWTIFLRKSIGWAVTLEPIEILKNKIQEAFQECANLANEIKNFWMEIGKVETRINKNMQIAKEKMENADYLSKKGEQGRAENEAAYATRLIEMNNNKLIPLKSDMEKAVKFLEKLRENLFNKAERSKNELEINEIEYNALKSGRNAMRSAMRAFNGDPDKQMLYDMAAETIETQIGEMMGEIKQGVQLTKDFMKSSDLENGFYNEKGRKMLEEYQQKGFKGILNSASDTNTISLPINNGVKIPVSSNEHSNMKSLLED